MVINKTKFDEEERKKKEETIGSLYGMSTCLVNKHYKMHLIKKKSI